MSETAGRAPLPVPTTRRIAYRAPLLIALAIGGLALIAAAGHAQAAGIDASGALDHAPTPIGGDQPAFEVGARVIVRADGDCLNIRPSPSIGAVRIVCVAEGSLLTVIGVSLPSDGYRWAPVTNGAISGWAADLYLEPAPVVGATPPPPVVTAATGQPNVFAAPAPGKFRIGVSGTGDPLALIAAQPFEVQAIFKVDGNGRWIFYLVGAPAFVNSLTEANLEPTDIVILKRSATITTIATTTARRVTATLSYYYCQQGSIAAGIGDGGGFCGVMASGQTVFEGAAACSRANMGQRFRILGDPNARTYTCADTGSAVLGEHRDIFFHNSDDGYRWWLQVDHTATIEIVE